LISSGALTESPKIKGVATLYTSKPLAHLPTWEEEYKPKLVKLPNGNVIISTKFSQLLNKPPIMVAGMTPCTANESFVSSILNAGYHVELAGGGQHTLDLLRTRINNITTSTNDCVTLNILYLNPRLWNMQYPEMIKLRENGIKVDGICVAAGVPSPDIAQQLISDMKRVGMKHVAFKPGTVDDIRRVVDIAKENENFPVVLQWTGGRGGGHHSYEDFHTPILETYGIVSI
jgi:enoyl reductase-like protein